MHKSITVAFLLLICNVSFSQTQKVSTKWDNGKIASQGVTLNGFEHGKWEYFDREGRLMQEIEYDRGVANGKITYYYRNGKKQNEGHFSQGIHDGAFFEWYETEI